MKVITVSLEKVGKVTEISEEISEKSLLHALFLPQIHAMVFLS